MTNECTYCHELHLASDLRVMEMGVNLCDLCIWDIADNEADLATLRAYPRLDLEIEKAL